MPRHPPHIVQRRHAKAPASCLCLCKGGICQGTRLTLCKGDMPRHLPHSVHTLMQRSYAKGSASERWLQAHRCLACVDPPFCRPFYADPPLCLACADPPSCLACADPPCLTCADPHFCLAAEFLGVHANALAPLRLQSPPQEHFIRFGQSQQVVGAPAHNPLHVHRAHCTGTLPCLLSAVKYWPVG